MRPEQLILKPLNNSSATLVCAADGTVVGKYTFLSGFDETFQFKYMVEFFPTEEFFFSPNIREVHYCLKQNWVLYITANLI